MTIKKVDAPIVCDALGCGKIACYELIFKTGFSLLLCEKCFAELKSAIIKEKIDAEKSKA